MPTKCYSEKLKVRDQWGDRVVDMNVIFKWVLRKWCMMLRSGSVGSGYGRVAGNERGNDLPGLIKDDKFQT
jgi:hypothetical protein